MCLVVRDSDGSARTLADVVKTVRRERLDRVQGSAGPTNPDPFDDGGIAQPKMRSEVMV
jgi:hypothetical protein